MGNDNPQDLISDISTITPDYTKKIESNDVLRKIGKDIYTRDMWERTCGKLFNEKYEDAKVITIPSDRDKIMDTFSKLCLENQSRGFVFKDYDMLDHLSFLGYNRAMLKRKLGTILENSIKTYLAYIERMNVIFLCCNINSDSSAFQCMNFVPTSIKYFLTLYSEVIESTEVKVIGLLIQGNEAKGKYFECAFCELFSLTIEDFESRRSFNKWWSTVENYRNWWDLSNPTKSRKLFRHLAARILGYMEKQKGCSPGLISDNRLERENFICNKEVHSSTKTDKLMSDQIHPTNYQAPANPIMSSNDDARKTLAFNKEVVSSTETEKLISEEIQQTNYQDRTNSNISSNDDARKTLVGNKEEVSSTKTGKLISEQIEQTNYQDPENPTMSSNDDARKTLAFNKEIVSSTETEKLISEEIQQTNCQDRTNSNISSNDDARKTLVGNKEEVSSTETGKLISEQIEQTNYQDPANPTMSSNDDARKTLAFNKEIVSSTETEKLIFEEIQQNKYQDRTNSNISSNDDARKTLVGNKEEVSSTETGKLISEQIEQTNYQDPENPTMSSNDDARKTLAFNKEIVSSTETGKLISEEIQQTNYQDRTNSNISSSNDARKTFVVNKEVVSSTETGKLISEQIEQTNYQDPTNRTMPSNDDAKKTLVVKVVIETIGQGIRFRQTPQSGELNCILEIDNPEQSNLEKARSRSLTTLDASDGNPNHSLSKGIPVNQYNVSETRNEFCNKDILASRNMEETTFQQNQLSEDDVDQLRPEIRNDVKYKPRDSSYGNLPASKKERLLCYYSFYHYILFLFFLKVIVHIYISKLKAKTNQKFKKEKQCL